MVSPNRRLADFRLLSRHLEVQISAHLRLQLRLHQVRRLPLVCDPRPRIYPGLASALNPA